MLILYMCVYTYIHYMVHKCVVSAVLNHIKYEFLLSLKVFMNHVLNGHIINHDYRCSTIYFRFLLLWDIQDFSSFCLVFEGLILFARIIFFVVIITVTCVTPMSSSYTIINPYKTLAR